MALLARLLGFFAALLMPGGVIVLGTYFLARAVKEAYRAQEARGAAAFATAVKQVRFGDAWKQARRFALRERFD